jgi:hypothetical protein
MRFEREAGIGTDLDFSNANGEKSSRTGRVTAGPVTQEVVRGGWHNTGWSKHTYVALAAAFYKAMKGWGTDEAMIMKIFTKILTGPNNLAQNRMAIFNRVFATIPGNNYNTIQWLRSELGKSDIRRLNQAIVSKGITDMVI